MPSSLPSFFLSLCTTLFAFVPWVPSGTALFPVPSGGLPLKIRQFPLDASDSI